MSSKHPSELLLSSLEVVDFTDASITLALISNVRKIGMGLAWPRKDYPTCKTAATLRIPFDSMAHPMRGTDNGGSF